MPHFGVSMGSTSHHKVDAQAPWCSHESTGDSRHFHVYFNPQQSTTLLQIAQAIEQNQMSTHTAVHVRDYSFVIQTFFIRGVRYDKNSMQTCYANQLLSDGEVFNFQAWAGGRQDCIILWSVDAAQVTVASSIIILGSISILVSFNVSPSITYRVL